MIKIQKNPKEILSLQQLPIRYCRETFRQKNMLHNQYQYHRPHKTQAKKADVGNLLHHNIHKKIFNLGETLRCHIIFQTIQFSFSEKGLLLIYLYVPLHIHLLSKR